MFRNEQSINSMRGQNNLCTPYKTATLHSLPSMEDVTPFFVVVVSKLKLYAYLLMKTKIDLLRRNSKQTSLHTIRSAWIQWPKCVTGFFSSSSDVHLPFFVESIDECRYVCVVFIFLLNSFFSSNRKSPC